MWRFFPSLSSVYAETKKGRGRRTKSKERRPDPDAASGERIGSVTSFLRPAFYNCEVVLVLPQPASFNQLNAGFLSCSHDRGLLLQPPSTPRTMAQPTAEPPTPDKPPVVSLLPPGSANDRSGLESAAEASLPSTPTPVKADEPLSSSSSAASLTPTHRARFDIYLNHGPPSSPLAGTPRGMYEEDDGQIEAPVTTGSSTTVLDIEHTEVDNDPRLWSDRKKTLILVMVSIASITPTLGAVSDEFICQWKYGMTLTSFAFAAGHLQSRF